MEMQLSSYTFRVVSARHAPFGGFILMMRAPSEPRFKRRNVLSGAMDLLPLNNLRRPRGEGRVRD